MSEFVRVNPGGFNIRDNFWELNFAISLIPGFRELYQKDKSPNREESSVTMWTLWLWGDPHKQNPVYQQDIPVKIKSVQAYNPKFDPSKKGWVALIKLYDQSCLTKAARAFKRMEDKLEDRADFMEANPYSVGTVDMLEKMHKNTASIMKEYAQARTVFEADQADGYTVYKGREETLREKKNLPLDVREDYGTFD